MYKLKNYLLLLLLNYCKFKLCYNSYGIGDIIQKYYIYNIIYIKIEKNDIIIGFNKKNGKLLNKKLIKAFKEYFKLFEGSFEKFYIEFNKKNNPYIILKFENKRYCLEAYRIIISVQFFFYNVPFIRFLKYSLYLNFFYYINFNDDDGVVLHYIEIFIYVLLGILNIYYLNFCFILGLIILFYLFFYLNLRIAKFLFIYWVFVLIYFILLNNYTFFYFGLLLFISPLYRGCSIILLFKCLKFLNFITIKILNREKVGNIDISDPIININRARSFERGWTFNKGLWGLFLNLSYFILNTISFIRSIIISLSNFLYL